MIFKKTIWVIRKEFEIRCSDCGEAFDIDLVTMIALVVKRQNCRHCAKEILYVSVMDKVKGERKDWQLRELLPILDKKEISRFTFSWIKKLNLAERTLNFLRLIISYNADTFRDGLIMLFIKLIRFVVLAIIFRMVFQF